MKARQPRHVTSTSIEHLFDTLGTGGRPRVDGAGMDTGFEKWHLYTACKLKLTHFYDPGGTRCDTFGTGFMTQFPSGDPRIAIVTNRHLTDIPWAKPERDGAVLESVEIEFWQSENFRLIYKTDNVAPLFHEDDSIDVSVVAIGPAFDTAATVAALYDSIDKLIPDPNVPGILFNHAMSWDYLLKCEELWPDLIPGEFVVFPGYPAWFDKLETRPVFRSGMIASDPQRPYRQREGATTNHDGNQQVLFDAFSTSGNSGSPVFVAQRGMASSANIKYNGAYHRSFLIGINAGHFNDTDSERPNDHAGLSRMHKLSAVMEILRANTSPSEEVSTASILISKELVDAHGGIPQSFLDVASSDDASPEQSA